MKRKYFENCLGIDSIPFVLQGECQLAVPPAEPLTDALNSEENDDDDESDENEGEQALNQDKQKGLFQTDNFLFSNSPLIINNKKTNNNDTPILDKFSSDVTKAAEEGLLDPVIGREREIDRLVQILSRRKKNNPILIGDSGVGKTAIVEGLASKIINGEVPHSLLGKRLVRLNMASIVAGTKYRGQFEERMQNLISELKKHHEIILFLDEIHTIIGAGASSGGMDAANLLKPALAQGELQCIGATTMDEYRNSIEKSSALERRFQKILVEPTTKEETLQILAHIKQRYEDFHHVVYTQEALDTAVSLADRFITNRNFPDKAIDLIDEVGSKASMKVGNLFVGLKELLDNNTLSRKKKTGAVISGNFELAHNLRDKITEQEKHIAEEVKKLNSNPDKKMMITADMVAEVASMITGIPVTRMAQTEGKKLKEMQDVLSHIVIDQDTAIEKLVKAIQRSRIGLKDPDRPIGSFMFLGPTGVGKTLLAKELARYMFGTEKALIRIDMSEYMEKFTVSRLVGAPPGYVGYEEGGLLTEQVRRKPYSIILLDEIEKAHPDVFNLLLQVMDEGRLTDSNGRTVDFRNAVIIMTSNVGSRQLKEFGQGIGFTRQSNAESNADSIIRKAIQKQFAPEFINRLDEIITFHSLNQDSILKIIDLELRKLIKRMECLGYSLKITEESRKFLALKGFDTQYGARPLRRAIQTYLEDEISTLIINEEPTEGSRILADVDKDKLTLQVTNCPTLIPILQKV